MKKKEYIRPQTDIICVSHENLMITASPGVSNEEFDPDNDEIGAKQGTFFDNEDWPSFDAWED